jgi:hypothetical protein
MQELWLPLHSSFGFGIVRFPSSSQANSSSGHTQQEHETHHGSMSRTRWAVDGPDGSFIELGGRKFSSNDDGAPMLCNLVCTSIGRHVHIDDCRGDHPHNSEVLHINERIVPNPDQAKDWITHGLHWRRMGEFVLRSSFEALLIRPLGFKGNGNDDSMGYLKSYLSL